MPRDRCFRVVFRDGATAAVVGTELKQLPAASNNPADPGTCSIVSRSTGRESTIAIFRIDEVAAIFDGAITTPSGGE
ncbi:MAG: DUF4843 domain-containing protein [Gemmataceae bacterium]|nr:DUF4843 domain-containing protein [Gemmataceae bacterium]